MLNRLPSPTLADPDERKRIQRRDQARRHRARQRKARRCCLVEYDGDVTELLIRQQCLKPNEATDDRAVGIAATTLLAISARST
jgi:hypothetical protein